MQGYTTRYTVVTDGKVAWIMDREQPDQTFNFTGFDAKRDGPQYYRRALQVALRMNEDAQAH